MAAVLREVAGGIEEIQQPEVVVHKTAEWVLDSEKVRDFLVFYAGTRTPDTGDTENGTR
jgi:hypothetical protein